MDEMSFYSIDRLMEFGLSLGIATQMAGSMNMALQGMRVPGAGRSPQPMPGEVASPAATVGQALYYAVVDGAAQGPLTAAELARLITEKRVTKETYIWKPGMPDWQLAESIPEVLQLVALTPPPVPAGM